VPRSAPGLDYPTPFSRLEYYQPCRMHRIYFEKLPFDVSRSVFCDAIENFVHNTRESTDLSKPLIGLATPEYPTADYKHCGYGHIDFDNEKAVEAFLARVCLFVMSLI
jgi:hypothetical protein